MNAERYIGTAMTFVRLSVGPPVRPSVRHTSVFSQKGKCLVSLKFFLLLVAPSSQISD